MTKARKAGTKSEVASVPLVFQLENSNG